MTPRIAFLSTLFAWPCATVGQPLATPPVNVALGKPYRLAPMPNYPLTTDAGDALQLTDGKLAGSGFWFDKAAVGWAGMKLATITIDLGSEFEISGASFSTAAGRAEVEWPSGILVLGSVDGRSYGLLGDLVALQAAAGRSPGSEGFARHRFEAHGLEGQARYVRLMVDATGPYIFVDEVEIFGQPAVASRAPPAASEDTDTLFWRTHAASRLRAEVDRRLVDARTRLSVMTVAPTERTRLAAEIGTLSQAVRRLSPDDWTRAGTQYPMNALHAAALGIIGKLEESPGGGLRVWAANPWDPLDLTTPPPSGDGSYTSVALMNEEVRSAALNIRNSTSQALLATVSFGDVDALEPGWIEARTVAWSGDADGKPVALALLPPTPVSAITSVNVPAGVTQQLWFTFAPKKVPIGLHERALRVSTPGTPDVNVVAKVRILPGRFPARPRLHLSGWDYLNDGGMPASTATRAEIAALLRSFGVDVPWAKASAMPFGRYDANGRLVEAPNTAVFDSWVALWPKASRYRVFVSARDDLAGIRRGAPSFEAAVRSWTTFWATHVAKLGIRANSIDLLFVDEPRGPREDAERQVAWARALEMSGSGFQVWLDPVYADPDQTPADLVRTANTLCLSRNILESSGGPYRAFARRLLSAGKVVELYGTDGPATKLDPYAYSRLLSWRAFDIGATAVSVWSFTDTGSGSSWREYEAPRIAYSPLFLDGASVLPGKHLFALREGVEDYEYLALLRDGIAEEAARRSAYDPALTRARTVLSSTVDRVLGSSIVAYYPWLSVKDRTAADTARIEIAEELQRLRAAPLIGPRER